jgi:alpha-L-fucosidase
MKPIRTLMLATLICCMLNIHAQIKQNYQPSESNLKARERFQDMKFGMFIHWGIYSILGDGEWVMYNRKIPYGSYKRLTSFFNPQAFNAAEWVSYAKNAGMKYITFTTRHHDGFSMFKTKASPYNIVDATPYQKDPLKALAEECEKQGIELRLYYSLLDWGRSDYAFGSKIVNGAPEQGDWKSYINFMKTQLTELITNYPAIKGIWFDGDWERKEVNWHYDEIYALIHKLNPTIMVGNNHHVAPKDGEDLQIFERDLPGNNLSGFSPNVKIGDLPLETCETMNGTWGFNINDQNYKSSKTLVHYLVGAAGRNANFLLNVGPMPNGKFQPEFIDTLAKIGDWMKTNGESIYGTRGNVIAPQPWGTVTLKENVVYIHVLKMPELAEIFLPGVKNKVASAKLLGGGKAIKFKQDQSGVTIYLTGIVSNGIDDIVKLSYR